MNDLPISFGEISKWRRGIGISSEEIGRWKIETA